MLIARRLRFGRCGRPSDDTRLRRIPRRPRFLPLFGDRRARRQHRRRLPDRRAGRRCPWRGCRRPSRRRRCRRDRRRQRGRRGRVLPRAALVARHLGGGVHAVQGLSPGLGQTIAYGIDVWPDALSEPFPPCGGRLGWGCRRTIVDENAWRFPAWHRALLVRHAHRSCGGTPHPASPRFAPLTKAPHPSHKGGRSADQFFRRDSPESRAWGGGGLSVSSNAMAAAPTTTIRPVAARMSSPVVGAADRRRHAGLHGGVGERRNDDRDGGDEGRAARARAAPSTS